MSDSGVVRHLENFADQFGLMQGELAPVKRFAVGAAVGGAIAYGLHPDVAFVKGPKGNWIARPFGMGKGDASTDNAVAPTLMPAWLITILPGVLFSVLI